MSSIPGIIIEKFKNAFRPHMNAVTESQPTPVTPVEVARHPLQDDIDVLAAKIANDMKQGVFTAPEVGAKLDERRQVLNLQYRQTLGVHRKGGDKQEQDTVTSVLSTLTARFKELEEDIGRMVALAKGPVKSAPRTGMIAKELGAEYVGESRHSGWREGKRPENKSASEVYDIRQRSVLFRLTAQWNDKQRDEHEVSFNNKGSMSVANGDLSDYNSYALDPDTGKMYLFSNTTSNVRALTKEEKDELDKNLADVKAVEEKFREELATKGVDQSVLESGTRLAQLIEQIASNDETEKKEASSILFLEAQIEESKNDPYFTPDAVNKSIYGHRAKIDSAQKSTKKLEKEIGDLKEKIKAAEEKGVKLKEVLTALNYIQATRERFELAIASGNVTLFEHHSTPLQGGDVGGAGELKFIDKGKLGEISNVSGHYKPKFVQLAQTIELLMREGATQQSTMSYIDDSGKGDNLQYHARLKKLYDVLKEKSPELPVLKSEAEELQKRLDDIPEDLNEESRAFVAQDLQNELDSILAKIAPLEEALLLLRKFGVGPSNKPIGTKVEFIDDIQNKTGADIHREKGKQTNLPTAEEFLQSGGGQKVYDPKTRTYTDKTVKGAKGEVLQSLKTKTSETRSKLDQDAEQRARDLLAQLQKHMSPEAFEKFQEDNRAPTDEDLRRALAAFGVKTKPAPKRTELGERLAAKLKELGVNNLEAAKHKLGIDGEDWAWMNSDVLRAKVVLGDMTVRDAVAQGENDPTGVLVTERLEVRDDDDEEDNNKGSVAQGPDYDESALEKKLDELGATSLEDAWRKMGLDGEDWYMMNRDKWRAKVILGELSSREAVDLCQKEMSEEMNNDFDSSDDEDDEDESSSRLGSSARRLDSDDSSDDDLSDDDEPDKAPDFDEEALQKKLEELGAKGLKDAWRKLHLDDEDWAMMNTDKWRAKVVLGEMSASEAVDKAQEELAKF